MIQITLLSYRRSLKKIKGFYSKKITGLSVFQWHGCQTTKVNFNSNVMKPDKSHLGNYLLGLYFQLQTYVTMLLHQGARPHSEDEFGQTPLHHAVCIENQGFTIFVSIFVCRKNDRK